MANGTAELTFSRTPLIRELKEVDASSTFDSNAVRPTVSRHLWGLVRKPLSFPENNRILLKCRERLFRFVFLSLPAAFIPTSAASLRAQCSLLPGRGTDAGVGFPKATDIYQAAALKIGAAKSWGRLLKMQIPGPNSEAEIRVCGVVPRNLHFDGSPINLGDSTQESRSLGTVILKVGSHQPQQRAGACQTCRDLGPPPAYGLRVCLGTGPHVTLAYTCCKLPLAQTRVALGAKVTGPKDPGSVTLNPLILGKRQSKL